MARLPPGGRRKGSHREVRRVARRGDPVMGRQLLTNDADTDLVIVGTHGRTGLLHALVGSVALRIMDAVPCDILAVPSRQR